MTATIAAPVSVTHNYCCMCIDMTSGTTGCFVFAKSAPFVAVSPVFGGLIELYAWMRANGWQCIHEPSEPWGAVQRHAA